MDDQNEALAPQAVTPLAVSVVSDSEVQINVGDAINAEAQGATLTAKANGHLPPAWLATAGVVGASPSKKTAPYFKNQGALVESYKKAHAPQTAAEEADTLASAMKDLVKVKYVVNACFMANVALLASNIFVVVWSGSLAVVAASIDCALDLLSTGIIYCTARKQAKSEPYLYPVGKSRLEPLSIVIFASIMAMAAMQLTVESAQSIAKTVTTGVEVLKVDTIAIVLLAVSITVKFSLMVLCYCMRSLSDSVHALALEYRNDAIITLSSLVAIVLASNVPNTWWLDPAAAIAMAVLILVTWIKTGKEHVVLLAGKVADPTMLSTLTYIAAHHDARISYVDTVRAYYSGAHVLAEVDVVLPRTMTLEEAHDIGESLQQALERVDFVERAFVHLDFEFTHSAKDEHASSA